MKKFILVSIALTLASCGPRRPGKMGIEGKTGLNGNDGLSLVVDVQTLISPTGMVCKRTDIFQDVDRNNFYSSDDFYQNGFLACDGAIGDQGAQGETGENGANGSNGTNGQDGLNADITFQIVEILDPCGAQHPNGYDEVILKLGNGKYLSSFSDNANGLNTRLGVLKPGSYVTTDGTGCHFTI